MSAGDPIEAYLADLDRRLVATGRYRRRVLTEAADHLREAAAALEAGGQNPAAAAVEAVRRFGGAASLAGEINVRWASATVRRAPVFAFVGGAGVFGVALAGIPATPPGTPRAGAVLVGVSSTVALLAFQLAVVAGGVALLRVLGRRSAPVLGSADRALVWRAARLCGAAAALAAIGFVGVAVGQAQRTGTGSGRAAGAAAAMALVLAGAGLGLRRPLATGLTNEDGTAALQTGRQEFIERVARAGESILAIVRSIPGPATALVAVTSGAGAFAHAETSLAGSVLAGIVEATAVVVFARVFGPTLELRPAKQ